MQVTVAGMTRALSATVVMPITKTIGEATRVIGIMDVDKEAGTAAITDVDKAVIEDVEMAVAIEDTETAVAVMAVAIEDTEMAVAVMAVAVMAIRAMETAATNADLIN